MRVGLVGCGHIGTVHSFALAQLRQAGAVDARVTSTFDTDPERARRIAAYHDARPASTLSELAGDVDVMWVCTWTAAHRAAVEEAADRGVPVFCEKPLAPTLAECEAVAAALRRVPHQVGLVLRHAPVFLEAARRVRSGAYGAVLAATLRDDQYFPIQGMYGSTWRADAERAGGGTLIEHSIHDIDMLLSILGPVESVDGRVHSHFGYDGIDDAAAALLQHTTGATSTLTSVWHQVLSRPSTRRLEVFCEEGLLWTDDDYLGPLHVETSSGQESFVGEAPEWAARFTVPDVAAKALAQYAEPAKEFLDALARDGADARGNPDVEVALAAHRVVDAVYRSSNAGGGPVSVAR